MKPTEDWRLPGAPVRSRPDYSRANLLPSLPQGGEKLRNPQIEKGRLLSGLSHRPMKVWSLDVTLF